MLESVDSICFPAPPTTRDKLYIALPLVGVVIMLAYYLGVWDFPGAKEERERRARAQAERTRIENMLRNSDEEAKRRAAESAERSRRMDEEMKRTFGR